MMNKLLLTLTICFFPIICPAKQYFNSLPINILNSTAQSGFFGTCIKELHPDGHTLCSIPQEITPGYNRIFIPPYPQTLPVFSTDDTSAYTCGTQENPLKQMLFSTKALAQYTLVLDSFIKDKDGNIIAVQCELMNNPQ